MLEPALQYADQLKKRFRETWFDDRYKYYQCSTYYEEYKIDDGTWSRHQFVSTRDEEIIGYIGYCIGRSEHDVSGLAIVNFEDKPSMTFSRDLGTALKDIFEKFCFRRLEFTVVVGNPIEKSYDKMCLRNGGRIVGQYRERVRLIDGQYYDEKSYEILAEDYFKAKEQRIINHRKGERHGE